MFPLKVRKVGNSLGMVLPKEAAAALRVSEGSTVYLTETPDGDFRVTADDPVFERQMKIAEDLMRRYRNTFRALAR